MKKVDERNDEWIKAERFARGPDPGPDQFRELGTLSSGFLYQFTPVATEPAPPEMVYVPKNLCKRINLLTSSHLGIIRGGGAVPEGGVQRRSIR